MEGLRGGFMRKAREPAKNEFQEQGDETSSQGTPPMATTRYPKRALADDTENSVQGPPPTAIVRTRSGVHHHHRREPAAEAPPTPEAAEVKTEAGPAAAEAVTNGTALAAASGTVAARPEPEPKIERREFKPPGEATPLPPASPPSNGRQPP